MKWITLLLFIIPCFGYAQKPEWYAELKHGHIERWDTITQKVVEHHKHIPKEWRGFIVAYCLYKRDMLREENLVLMLNDSTGVKDTLYRVPTFEGFMEFLIIRELHYLDEKFPNEKIMHDGSNDPSDR